MWKCLATIRPPRHPSGFMFSLSDSLDVPFTSAMTFVISSVPSQTGERVIAVPEAAALQCFGAFLGPFSLFNTQFHNLFQPILWTFVLRISHFLICTFACCEFRRRLCLLAASSHTFKQANVKFESHHGFLLSFFFFVEMYFFLCWKRPLTLCESVHVESEGNHKVLGRVINTRGKRKTIFFVPCVQGCRSTERDVSELTETSRERESTCVCWRH